MCSREVNVYALVRSKDTQYRVFILYSIIVIIIGFITITDSIIYMHSHHVRLWVTLLPLYCEATSLLLLVVTPVFLACVRLANFTQSTARPTAVAYFLMCSCSVCVLGWATYTAAYREETHTHTHI
eukprot:GHVR01012549.1.p1 GENE.GHVR01012549.1~~GHVR01012549.1.p1  ORF type:complete len:126 (-),score=25.99 GHVR01012549.1:352-729(-)